MSFSQLGYIAQKRLKYPLFVARRKTQKRGPYIIRFREPVNDIIKQNTTQLGGILNELAKTKLF